MLTGFTNVASVTGTPPPGVTPPPPANSPPAVVIVPGPGLSLDKQPPLQYVVPGGTATFTITVTNTGDITLTNVTVSDAQAPGCAQNVGTLNPGQSTSYQCTVAGVLTGFTNVATATGTPPPGITPPTTTSPPAQVIVAQPAIDIAKTPDLQTVSLGAIVTFTIEITNTGNVTLTNVTVTDPQAPGCNTVIASLAPGAKASYLCTAGPVNAGFTNVASVIGTPTDQNGKPIPGAQPPTDQDSAVVRVSQAGGIQLVKTAGNAPDGQVLYLNQAPPANVTYTYVVTNSGLTYMGPITVTDNILGLICTIPGPLAPGTSQTCTKLASVATDTTNIGTATGTPTDPFGTPIGPNVSATDNAVVKFLGSIGDFVWWDVNGNGGQDLGEPGIPGVVVQLRDATNTVISTTVTGPGGAYTFVGWPAGTYSVTIGSPLPGWTQTYAPPMPVNLAPGQTYTAADFGYDITSVVTVTKTLNTPQPVREGSPISFTITISNAGPSWLASVPLTDTYDSAYLTYGYLGSYANPTSDSNSVNIITGQGTIGWNDLVVKFGTQLAPNASFSVVVTFTASVDTSTSPNDVTINTATVAGALTDPDGPTGPLPGIGPLPPVQGSTSVRIINPTGLGLTGFSATAQGNTVELAWQTANEVDMLGFTLLRDRGDGNLEVVNSDLIFAQNAGANQGASYSFTDEGLQPGAYNYILAVVKPDGSVVRHEPVSVVVSGTR